MRAHYQRGYLRIGHRKTGPDCWEFLWWDIELTGHRVRRKAVIGTVRQYPNVEEAWQAINGLRVSINEARNRQQEQLVTVSDLADHYTRTELGGDPSDGGKSHSTKTVYKSFLARWVRPAWGSLNIRAVRTTAVEQWLRQLRREDGGPLAPSTKAKIRNVMSVLFNHAIRYEWLEQGKNPILLVRQGAKRQPVPLNLTLASELWAWKQDSPYSQPNDWVFASPHSRGRNPYWPDILLSRIVRPAAARAGIQKHIGWHTFRHSYSTMLIANGENVKVVQELMRHANCRCTLEIYSQARLQAKRDAQQRVVEMIIPRELDATETGLPLILANGEAATIELS